MREYREYTPDQITDYNAKLFNTATGQIGRAANYRKTTADEQQWVVYNELTASWDVDPDFAADMTLLRFPTDEQRQAAEQRRRAVEFFYRNWAQALGWAKIEKLTADDVATAVRNLTEPDFRVFPGRGEVVRKLMMIAGVERFEHPDKDTWANKLIKRAVDTGIVIEMTGHEIRRAANRKEAPVPRYHGQDKHRHYMLPGQLDKILDVKADVEAKRVARVEHAQGLLETLALRTATEPGDVAHDGMAVTIPVAQLEALMSL